ncbi:Short transient receptor potential channel 4-associated protein [Porphyridium purpureum]|uniref:Short transient receptor potential channel 4-associated protein n=1 Tax=Porphyridium purpureum TaxID=35688 RepID=A0A5J4YKP5_PORPP|nr:Short transient receptor potential channel 4-associated protein [Porphyridium purpureum]|eukprot:POR7441..scf261_15
MASRQERGGLLLHRLHEVRTGQRLPQADWGFVRKPARHSTRVESEAAEYVLDFVKLVQSEFLLPFVSQYTFSVPADLAMTDESYDSASSRGLSRASSADMRSAASDQDVGLSRESTRSEQIRSGPVASEAVSFGREAGLGAESRRPERTDSFALSPTRGANDVSVGTESLHARRPAARDPADETELADVVSDSESVSSRLPHVDLPDLQGRMQSISSFLSWEKVQASIRLAFQALVSSTYCEEFRDAFVSFNGPEALLNVLRLVRTLLERSAVHPVSRLMQDLVRNVAADAISLLKECCYGFGWISPRLGLQPDAVDVLFYFVTQRDSFEPAVLLIEDLLAMRDDTFELATIWGIEELILTLSPYELALFCRVLTLTLFEPEERQGGDSLRIYRAGELLQRRLSYSGSQVRVTDKNHALLLSMPTVIERLVLLLNARRSRGSARENRANGNPVRPATFPPQYFDMPAGDVTFENVNNIMNTVDAAERAAEAGQPADAVPAQFLQLLMSGLDLAPEGANTWEFLAANAAVASSSGLSATVSLATADADQLRQQGASDHRTLNREPITLRSRSAPQSATHLHASDSLSTGVPNDEQLETLSVDVTSGSRLVAPPIEDVANEFYRPWNDRNRARVPSAVVEARHHVVARDLEGVDGMRGNTGIQAFGADDPDLDTAVAHGMQESMHNLRIAPVNADADIIRDEAATIATAGTHITNGNPDLPLTVREMLAAGNAGGADNFTPTELNEMQGFLTDSTLKDVALLTHQVEVLFVICTLLGGRRKLDAQERFSYAGLVDALYVMYEVINWNEACIVSSRPHGPDCECDPESVLRIQFLRLLHNFCDRDANRAAVRRQLLSPFVYRLVSLYDTEYDGSHGLEWIDAAKKHTHEEQKKTMVPNEPREWQEPLWPGLLDRLIGLLVHCPPNCSYRVGLTSGVEAYLRGAGRLEQTVIARRGLLKYLMMQVCSGESDGGAIGACGNSSSIQATFDLLGELCKFNRDVLTLMNEILASDEALVPNLMHNLTTNLVDSNVFVRSMILSLERFHLEDLERVGSHRRATVASFPEVDKHGTPYPFANCHIAKIIQLNRTRLLCDLMASITVEDVNQENICCLNTAIVILIFADARGEVEHLLQDVDKLAQADNAQGLKRTISNKFSVQEDGVAAIDRRSNFRDLLDFWEDYYRYRGTDVQSLEWSSQIPFSEWLRVVAVLKRVL